MQLFSARRWFRVTTSNAVGSLLQLAVPSALSYVRSLSAFYCRPGRCCSLHRNLKKSRTRRTIRLVPYCPLPACSLRCILTPAAAVAAATAARTIAQLNASMCCRLANNDDDDYINLSRRFYSDNLVPLPPIPRFARCRRRCPSPRWMDECRRWVADNRWVSGDVRLESPLAVADQPGPDRTGPDGSVADDPQVRRRRTSTGGLTFPQFPPTVGGPMPWCWAGCPTRGYLSVSVVASCMHRIYGLHYESTTAFQRLAAGGPWVVVVGLKQRSQGMIGMLWNNAGPADLSWWSVSHRDPFARQSAVESSVVRSREEVRREEEIASTAADLRPSATYHCGPLAVHYYCHIVARWILVERHQMMWETHARTHAHHGHNNEARAVNWQADEQEQPCSIKRIDALK